MFIALADEDLIEKLNGAVDAENERQTKLPVGKAKVNNVISAATTTHPMPSDVETKAKEMPKQKPEESVQAKLLAAVETMQAEVVQFREIVNQQANDRSRGARSRSTWRSGYCYLNKGEYSLNQSTDDSFVERVAKNNS